MTDTLARQRQIVGSPADWADDDLILGDGELALERAADGKVRARVGDGATPFSAAPYLTSSLAPLRYMGATDPTAPPPAADPGDVYSAEPGGVVAASWGPPAAGATVAAGGLLAMADDGAWHVLGGAADLAGLVTEAALGGPGGAAMVGNEDGGTVQDVIDANRLVWDNLAAQPYNANPGPTDQTPLVQAALNAMPVNSTLYIPAGVKFSLRALTFPARGNMNYLLGDDMDAFFLSADAASGERTNFSFNSSYPADPTGAAVNEVSFGASLHPGVIVDCRKDVAGHDAYFRPGQDRGQPARASFLIRDGQSNVFGTHYEFFGDSWSNTSGVALHVYRRIQTIKGVKSIHWPAPPAVNDRIGGTGGPATAPPAAGFFLYFDPVTDETVVEWIIGRFAVGMTITNTTPAVDVVATIAATATSGDGLAKGQPLSQCIRTGNWGLGVPPGIAGDLLDVGGDIAVSSTVTFGQFIAKTVNYPGFIWRRDPNAPTVGVSVRQHPAENIRRLWVYDKPDETAGIARGMVGAVCASARVSASLALSPANINVEALTNPATGQYKIDFRRDVINAGYQVQVSMSSLMARASGSTFYTVGYEFTEVDDVFVYVNLVDLVANTVTPANIPAASSISITVLGADI